MTGLDLIASLVESLAWPVAVLVIGLIFRSRINAILERPLRRAKAGPFEMEWEQRAAAASVELAKSPEVAATPIPESALNERLAGLANIDPRAAVVEAFLEVERALRQRLADLGIDDAQAAPFSKLLEEARERRLLSEHTLQAVTGLVVMRNLALHGPDKEIDSEKATEFIALSAGVVYAVQAKKFR